MKKRRVLSLRPTQIAVGMDEVQAKVRKLKRCSRKKLAKFIKKHPVTVIRGPDKRLYVTDHHHALAALWLVGVKKVPIDVQEDLSDRRMSMPGFWKFMSSRGCVHLYDQFGDGPREPLYLPTDIRGMGDDPYRSLAWLAKKKGAFDDSDVRYYEFEWAQLLRRDRLLARFDRTEVRRALRDAVKLCSSSTARGLPGYRGTASRSGVTISLTERRRAAS